MKILTLAVAVLLALPLGSALAEEAKPADPVEVCKSKAVFQYNFDMMNIESGQLERKISHRDANEKKKERHERLQEELEECDDLKDD